MLYSKYKKIKINRKDRLFLFVSIILFCILNISFVYFATSTNQNIYETTKKPKGHKIYNAEYFDYDPNSDKYRIIIAEGEGGSGEGGGRSGGGTSNDTGQGSINGNPNSSAGGSSGAGANRSAGSNGTGSGSANTNNQSSNKTADAIRKSLEEAKRESIARILETARNKQEAESSIAEQESIYESIQKRIRQESINARINAERFDIQSPTVNVVIETVARQTLPSMVTTHYDNPVAPSENIVPVENTIMPTAESDSMIEQTQLETFAMPIVEVNTTVESSGPGDNQLTTTEVEETTEEVTEQTVEKEVKEYKTQQETEEGGGNKTETVEIAEGNEDEFGSGNLGKENSDQESGELQDGNLSGFGYSESEGNFKNVKILELDRNGGLGIINVGRSKSIINRLLLLIIIILIVVGTIKYTLPFFIKTKNKKSYF